MILILKGCHETACCILMKNLDSVKKNARSQFITDLLLSLGFLGLNSGNLQLRENSTSLCLLD